MPDPNLDDGASDDGSEADEPGVERTCLTCQRKYRERTRTMQTYCTPRCRAAGQEERARSGPPN